MNIQSLIGIPKLENIKTALFIQPHPDDNEIGAGGLMAKLVNMGACVYSLTVTQGDGGSIEYKPEDLVLIRKREAQNASDVLGVHYLGDLGFNNSNPGTIDEMCEAIVAKIREVKPDAIFSVDPNLENECHPAHLKVGRAVMESFIRCNQAYYPFDKNLDIQPHRVDVLGQYFTKNYNTVVDVSDYYEQKMRSIRAHVSQVNDAYAGLLDLNFRAVSIDTPYEQAEKIKLLGVHHTHCFTMDLDLVLKNME